MYCPVGCHFLSNQALHRNGAGKTKYLHMITPSYMYRKATVWPPLFSAGLTPSRAELKMKYFLNKD